jgi:hypothetical protein
MHAKSLRGCPRWSCRSRSARSFVVSGWPTPRLVTGARQSRIEITLHACMPSDSGARRRRGPNCAETISGGFSSRAELPGSATKASAIQAAAWQPRDVMNDESLEAAAGQPLRPLSRRVLAIGAGETLQRCQHTSEDAFAFGAGRRLGARNLQDSATHGAGTRPRGNELERARRRGRRRLAPGRWRGVQGTVERTSCRSVSHESSGIAQRE